MRSIVLAFAAAAATVLLAGAAGAQPAPGQGGGPSPEMRALFQAMREACQTDATRLCPGKGGREMMMCLRENADKLGAPCKDAMSKLPQPPARPAG